MAHISPLEGEALIEGYLYAITSDPSARLPSKGSGPLMAKTILNYLAGASLWFQSVLGIPVTGKSPHTDKLLPHIADVIHHAQRWQRPRPRRNGYTEYMYCALFKRVTSLTASDSLAVGHVEAVVFDWVRLGIFTGSRGNEYCQTIARRHTFSKVPDTAAAGHFRGKALAFMACDFTFYDSQDNWIPPHLLATQRSLVSQVHICFRYDKSPQNFTVRKFSRSGHSFLCPVEAATSIVLRSIWFAISPDEPLGVVAFPSKNLTTRRNLSSSTWSKDYSFLRSCDIIKVMRTMVVLAYPDPNHYMRINITTIDCHSNRVTAALALFLAKQTFEAIAFKLRWSVESVKHYIRDCNRDIGRSTAAVIQGHFLL